MRYLRTCLLLVAAACVWLPARADAKSYRVGPAGAQDGVPFALACADGDFVVGVDYSVFLQHLELTGALRNMAAVCAQSGRTAKQAVGVLGTPDELPHSLRCAPGQFVFGLQAGLLLVDGQQRVRGFHLLCRAPGGPPQIARMKTYGAVGGAQVKCKGNDLASGLFGRVDALSIKAVGLACADVPGPVTRGTAKVESAPPIVPQDGAVSSNGLQEQTCGFCNEQVFADPTVNGTAVDVCLNWGTNCGQPAADAFCRGKGFAASSAHAARGNAPPTLVLGDNLLCRESYCARFSSVTCTR